MGSFAPSQANKGFSSKDKRCPYLLGNGIGPAIYQKLYQEWNDINTKDGALFESGIMEQVKKMICEMQAYVPEKHAEGVLSCQVSMSLQCLIPMISATTNWNAVHQYYVLDKTNYHVDIAMVEREKRTLHSLIEIKWVDGHFPESEGTAYAQCLNVCGSNPHRWLPVFTLSKHRMKFGVAFDGIDNRWVFSEIFDETWSCKSSTNEVLCLVKFITFLVRSTEVHFAYSDSGAPCNLVNGSGEVIAKTPSAIGNRVLLDKIERKVLKLYANREDASAALSKQNMMQSVLESRTHPVMHVGCCSNGICVLVDDFIRSEKRITLSHLIDLVSKVDKLYKKGLVHGDLRLPNIIFGSGGVTYLIDFDWSGEGDTTCFPKHVNREAFGFHSQRYVVGGSRIPSQFDWLCLADLMKYIGLPSVESEALEQNLEGVLDALSSLSEDEERKLKEASSSILSQAMLERILDLSSIGLTYYNKAHDSKGKRRKSEGDSSSSGTRRRSKKGNEALTSNVVDSDE